MQGNRFVRSPSRPLSVADGEVMTNIIDLANEETQKRDSVLRPIARAVGGPSVDVNDFGAPRLKRPERERA